MDSENEAIVILDDDPFFRQLLQAQLEDLGLSDITLCGTEKSLKESLARLGHRRVLLFCDLTLPGEDGLQVLINLRNYHFYFSAVIMSACDSRILTLANTLVQQLTLPVIGSYPKPFSPETLSAIVDTWRTLDSNAGSTTPALNGFDVTDALKNGWFLPYFQPIVEIASGRICGVEALARLNDPRLGQLEPKHFMPLLESVGKLDELSLQIAMAAISSFGRWAPEGMTLTFNLPVSLLRRSDLPDLLADHAHKNHVLPSQLLLEIAEPGIHFGSTALATATRLRLRGFKLSVDDFGAGTSSLLRLKSLPFSEIKINPEFVQGCHRGGAMRSILEYAVHVGKELKLEIVAEGVECAEDFEVVAGLGCDKAQGYFFGHAVPEAQILELLNSGPAHKISMLVSGLP